jgi:hypothetical protein
MNKKREAKDVDIVDQVDPPDGWIDQLLELEDEDIGELANQAQIPASAIRTPGPSRPRNGVTLPQVTLARFDSFGSSPTVTAFQVAWRMQEPSIQVAL